MRASQGTLARLRPVAAPLVLALFVASAEVVPAVHLATHRNGHTHGPAPFAQEPETPEHGGRGHHHDAGAPHDHDDPVAGLTWVVELFSSHHHDDEDDADHDHHDEREGGLAPAHAIPEADGHHGAPNGDRDHDRAPAGDHGDGSSAHFLLALVDGPPPLFLPPPPETQAAPPDTAIRTCVPAPLPQPPARGPPSLA